MGEIAGKIASLFGNVEDPRSKRNQRHGFESLITIGLLGGIAGIDSFSGLADFAESHEEALAKLLDENFYAPSHDTLQRFYSALDPEGYLACFEDFTKELAKKANGVIAIDGKTIRNSGSNPLHIVSAWCEENRMVLGQVTTDEKSNEITAIPKLLNLLDLTDRIVTIDAMGCQRNIAKRIVSKNGDYVLALKGNQKTLHDDVEKHFANCDRQKCSFWEEWDKGHGRIEHRSCLATAPDEWIKQQHHWPGLTSIAMVESTRIIGDKQASDTRFYLSSLPPNAEVICKAARRHWSIENKLHWVLDVVFNEDHSCITNDNAAEIMDIIRKWGLAIAYQQKGSGSIKSFHRKSSMSFKFLCNVLIQYFHA